MSSNQQSPRQSQNSSPLPSQSTTQSLIVSKVSINENETKILQDLRHNYVGIENISRLHGKDGKPINAIKIDFKSNKFTKQILDCGYVLIDGKQRPVQSYRSVVCHRCQNEGHFASACPQKPLTEQRVIEMFNEQKMQLEAMINAFENKWNTRLSSLTASPTNNNIDQILPIFNQLTTVCQQFNQQNVQMQKQLNSIVHQVQGVQVKLNNEQQQQPQSWSKLPVQNGH